MRTLVSFVPEFANWIPKPTDLFVTTDEPQILRICGYVDPTDNYLSYVQFDGHAARMRIKDRQFIKMTPALGEPVLFVADKLGMDPNPTPAVAEPATKKDAER